MKIKIKLMLLFVFVFVFLMIQSLSVFAELIELSRMLEGQQKPMERLSVFSEPPELDVLLDSVNIGKTPVISKQVSPGTYVLRVKDTEKEITIVSGKSLQLSLYKDALIEIPEKKAEAPTPSGPKEQPKIPEKKPEDSNKAKKQYDPFYWPMKPTGRFQGPNGAVQTVSGYVTEPLCWRLSGGMTALIRKLCENIPANAIKLNHPVCKIEKKFDGALIAAERAVMNL